MSHVLESYRSPTHSFVEFGLPMNVISEDEFLSNKTDVHTFGVLRLALKIVANVKGIEFSDSFKTIFRNFVQWNRGNHD